MQRSQIATSYVTLSEELPISFLFPFLAFFRRSVGILRTSKRKLFRPGITKE